MRLEQLVDNGLPFNAQTDWEPVDRAPTDVELEVATEIKGGDDVIRRYFWHDGDTIHGGGSAGPGAVLFRIVEDQS